MFLIKCFGVYLLISGGLSDGVLHSLSYRMLGAGYQVSIWVLAAVLWIPVFASKVD
jgi:hypothetical protein